MRLRKGKATFDVWVEKTPDGDLLWARDDGGPARTIETQWKFSVERDLVELVLERLTTGWTRERDPEREVDVDDEPRDPALEAALRADLADADAALVYADWYQHREHPRGELIAVQHARARDPSPEFEAAERELFETWHAHLLGPLDRPRIDYHLGITLDWQHGFIRRARIDGKGDGGEQLFWELLRHPSARFLRELEIGCHAFGDQDNQLMTALLLRAGPTPPLRKLVFTDFDDSASDSIDISRAWLGDLTGLSESYPLLEDVVIKGRGIGAKGDRHDAGLGGLALPHARRFAFRTSGLMKETLAAILQAPWPALTELEVWTGTGEYGCTCTAVDVERLFRNAPPKLRVLRLLDCEFTDELCPALVAFIDRHPLDELDLSFGTLTEAGAQILLDNQAILAKLGGLRIYDNCLSPAALIRLQESALTILETAPFPGDGWLMGDYDRTNGQKNGRYVSISE